MWILGFKGLNTIRQSDILLSTSFKSLVHTKWTTAKLLYKVILMMIMIINYDGDLVMMIMMEMMVTRYLHREFNLGNIHYNNNYQLESQFSVRISIFLLF